MASIQYCHTPRCEQARIRSTASENRLADSRRGSPFVALFHPATSQVAALSPRVAFPFPSTAFSPLLPAQQTSAFACCAPDLFASSSLLQLHTLPSPAVILCVSCSCQSEPSVCSTKDNCFASCRSRTSLPAARFLQSDPPPRRQCRGALSGSNGSLRVRPSERDFSGKGCSGCQCLRRNNHSIVTDLCVRVRWPWARLHRQHPLSRDRSETAEGPTARIADEGALRPVPRERTPNL